MGIEKELKDCFRTAKKQEESGMVFKKWKNKLTLE